MYGVNWMYHRRSERSVAMVPGHNAELGWNTTADDLAMAEFREAVRGRKIELRSLPLIEQMARLKFRPRSKQAEKDERVGDDKLQMRLDGGGART